MCTVNQWTNEAVNQWTSDLVNQWNSEPMNQHTINQWVSEQSTDEPVNQCQFICNRKSEETVLDFFFSPSSTSVMNCMLICDTCMCEEDRYWHSVPPYQKSKPIEGGKSNLFTLLDAILQLKNIAAGEKEKKILQLVKRKKKYCSWWKGEKILQLVILKTEYKCPKAPCMAHVQQ